MYYQKIGELTVKKHRFSWLADWQGAVLGVGLVVLVLVGWQTALALLLAGLLLAAVLYVFR